MKLQIKLASKGQEIIVKEHGYRNHENTPEIQELSRAYDALQKLVNKYPLKGTVSVKIDTSM